MVFVKLWELLVVLYKLNLMWWVFDIEEFFLIKSEKL